MQIDIASETNVRMCPNLLYHLHAACSKACRMSRRGSINLHFEPWKSKRAMVEKWTYIYIKSIIGTNLIRVTSVCAPRLVDQDKAHSFEFAAFWIHMFEIGRAH